VNNVSVWNHQFGLNASLRGLLLGGMSIFALMTPSCAEEASAAGQHPEDAQKLALNAESGWTGSAASAVETVVVTARRREENAQSVPISLDVLGRAELEKTGEFTLQQLQLSVPTLVVTSYNARNANINIRGLGNNVANANDGLEAGVGFYVDQVYYGRSGLSQFDLIDLEQIEVLHGPQGTLFGKNTTAGAINVTTRKPSFTPEAQVQITGGDFGYYQLQTSISGPILSDKIAGRITVADTKRGGFVTDITTGKKVYDYQNFTARGQLLADVTEDIEFRLITDFGRQKRHCCVELIDGIFTTYSDGTAIADNFYQKAARAGYTLPSSNAFNRITDAEAPFQANMETWGVSLQGDWKIGGGTLTSVTAYRAWNWYPKNDNDLIALPIIPIGHVVDHQHQWSEELRYSSAASETIDYQVGVYYFTQIVNGYTSVQFGSASPSWYLGATNPLYTAALSGYTTGATSNPETNSYAAFGQANWHIAPDLTLTGGLRYTYEDKQGTYNNVVTAAADISAFPVAQQAIIIYLRNAFNGPQYYSTRQHSGSLSGLATLSYQLSPTVLGYATYSHGEKSGGLNLTQLPATLTDPRVRPEVADNYEIGLKSQWFDQSLTLNLNVFWDVISDYQTPVYDTNPPYGFSISNIPSVRSRGFEGSAAWAPIDNLSISAGTSYTDATYVEYPRGPVAPELHTSLSYVDLSGKPLASAPKWVFTSSFDYSLPLGISAPAGLGALSGYIHADNRYQSSNFADVTDSVYTLIRAYDLTNVKVGVKADGGWELSFWANNLFNTQYFLTHNANSTGQTSGVIGDPRTAGATLSIKY